MSERGTSGLSPASNSLYVAFTGVHYPIFLGEHSLRLMVYGSVALQSVRKYTALKALFLFSFDLLLSSDFSRFTRGPITALVLVSQGTESK